MLSILNYSSVLFYELTPDEIELAGDASVQDGVLDLEYEAAYEGRVDFGFQDQPAAGLFLDQITETGLQCRSLSLVEATLRQAQGPKELAQGPAVPDQRPQAARA